MEQTPGAPKATDPANGNGHRPADAFAEDSRPPLLADEALQHEQSDQGDYHLPKGPVGVLALGALGVVYGDIGTSPLYTMREIFAKAGDSGKGEAAVLGSLSLVFWALILTVTVKYLVLILRADNRGEGGVLALARLAGNALPPGAVSRRGVIMLLSIIGMALFFGDGLITPAVTVLSAIEGIQKLQPALQPFIVPTAVVILFALFFFQSRGTERVGRLFGPVMMIWFAVLATTGLWQIVHNPGVLAALDPRHGIAFMSLLGWKTFVVLGAVVLAVTGGEALYADMGHFGRRPIRLAWFAVVLPALVLNYFGQGALLLHTPEALDHLFFEMVPDWALIPMIALSTLAAIIASQATISGVASLSRQAIQLGLLPRMTILHTSEKAIGQIYVPRMNWLQMAGVITLVVSFGSSSNLAGAYGIAVTGAMAIDAVLACIVAILIWRWHPLLAIGAFGALMAIDLAFFSATVLKIPDGAWFPLLMAAATWYLISSWRRGRALLYEQLQGSSLPVEQFLERMERAPMRVAGTAVFMTGDVNTVPLALLHNLKHNKVMHERVILMHVLTMDIPRVAETRRVEVRRLGKGFHTVVARYGFMEQPDVPAALARCRQHGLAYDEMQTSFFLGRETLVPSARSPLGRARQSIFIALSTTAAATKIFFRIPPNRAVELGAQVEV
ncbi:MAG: potassium transporter Kup [Alphaproteobacteria bacterium]|nr:potassium transporter Kup [Alphaproteobacteria bacterium]MCW5741973.1 potassium transporter Kup [Alphaproteobacteria bacterium]